MNSSNWRTERKTPTNRQAETDDSNDSNQFKRSDSSNRPAKAIESRRPIIDPVCCLLSTHTHRPDFVQLFGQWRIVTNRHESCNHLKTRIRNWLKFNHSITDEREKVERGELCKTIESAIVITMVLKYHRRDNWALMKPKILAEFEIINKLIWKSNALHQLGSVKKKLFLMDFESKNSRNERDKQLVFTTWIFTGEPNLPKQLN